MVVQIKNLDGLKQILAEAGNKLVVIDFMANWCRPCKIIGPKFEDYVKEYTNVIACKVDVDECDDIVTEYNIKNMPTFVFMKNERKVEEFSGAHVEKLINTIERLR